MQPVNRIIAANDSQNVAVAGQYVWLKASTGNIRVVTESGESSDFSTGDFVRFDNAFTGFRIVDLSGAQNEIVIAVAAEGEAGKYGEISISVPGTLVTTADVTLTAATKVTILAANANRREAIIEVNTETRIGDTNTGAARGVRVAAGATITLDTTAEIFGYAALAGVATVTEIES